MPRPTATITAAATCHARESGCRRSCRIARSIRGQSRSLSHSVCIDRAVSEISIYEASFSAQALQLAACFAAMPIEMGSPSMRRSSNRSQVFMSLLPEFLQLFLGGAGDAFGVRFGDCEAAAV